MTFNPKDPLALSKPLIEYSPDEMEQALAAAYAERGRKAAEQEQAHEAFHGEKPQYISVERRRGYKGRTVCRQCYYGKSF